MGQPKKWETYEQVATDLLNRFAMEFNLGHVEGKQLVPGQSGTKWEIDAKGIELGGDGFVVVECKRFTKGHVNQEVIGGLAFRIQDTGANGGVIVTPLGYQEGAKKVAEHAGIVTAKLSAEATRSDYVLEFLDKILVGVSDSVKVSDHVTVEVRNRDGKVIQKSESE
ncbi:restriction endonuclease [Halomonas sp. LBP4]|uniref:restriction endonuclease n=1 Tax=Halomonas sp. LBP4 TaxID=2044917 RepID=UPI000D756E98|nr:restriction endonuclease [Halomonas sp. LBP4]PXX94649.1 hypothetical protein CR157_21725 [Halomonas sp. LBP4]